MNHKETRVKSLSNNLKLRNLSLLSCDVVNFRAFSLNKTNYPSSECARLPRNNETLY